jgi:hypothetical protein
MHLSADYTRPSTFPYYGQPEVLNAPTRNHPYVYRHLIRLDSFVWRDLPNAFAKSGILSHNDAVT